MNLNMLKEPFEEKDIEWRIGRAGEKDGKTWATCLAYITNRAIMDRLDSVCGAENWENEFTESPLKDGVLCGLSIKIGSEWITKWDGAENTNFESLKGGLSGSMKRAAVQWGIGRYLYNLTEGYATISTNGKYYQSKDKSGKYQAFKWDPPALPKYALPPVKKPVEVLMKYIEEHPDKKAESLKYFESIKNQYTSAEIKLVQEA